MELARGVEDACVYDLLGYSFKDSKRFTADGSSLTDIHKREPFAGVVEEQRVGKRTPNAPVVINHAVADDVIPYRSGKQLGSDWCDKGARVTFNAGVTPTHLGGFLPHIEKSMLFFETRFAGANQASSCWRL